MDAPPPERPRPERPQPEHAPTGHGPDDEAAAKARAVRFLLWKVGIFMLVPPVVAVIALVVLFAR